MTQEDFEQSMERILAPVRAYAAANEEKLDKTIIKSINNWWSNTGYPYPNYEKKAHAPKVISILNEIYALLEPWPYQIDAIRFFAYTFAKAGVDREKGWEHLKKTSLKRNYYYKNADPVATRKTYDRMFNKVAIDTDFRDSFR